MEKSEFRVLFKHCFLMGKNTVQAKAWLDKCYPDSAPPKSTIEYWFAEFRRGRTSTDDAERSGRPKEAVIPGIIQQVRRLLLNDRKVKVREIAETIGISKGSVGKILHEHLHMKKLLAIWVPHFLNIDQKEQRINDSQRCLEVYNRNPREFLRRYITMDETWIHHYVPEDKQQSAEWVGPGERPSKHVKQDRWAGKVLARVFWDAHGIIFIDYLKKGKTVNKEYYTALVDRLNDEIKKKRPHLSKKKILFHQDNARPHKAALTMEKFNELGWELLPHPPYSPDLAPSDYYLFSNLKRWLAGRKFYSDDEVEWETDSYFGLLDKSHYSKGIEMLPKRWAKCIELDGDYI